MTQRNDGGSAFPSTPLGDDGKPGGAHRFGMSLRDWFAQSQPSDDLQDLSYHHLSPDAQSILAGEPSPHEPRDSAPGEERVKYQLDKARWQAKVTAALRYMHADAMLVARQSVPEEVAAAAPSEYVMLPAFNEVGSPIVVVAVHYEDGSRTQWSSRELWPAPQPDSRDELLLQCRDALQAAQRFIGTEYEMIADDGELLAHEARPTYEQVTATLMEFREAMGDD